MPYVSSIRLTGLIIQRFKGIIDYPAIICQKISQSSQDYQFPSSSPVDHKSHHYLSETDLRYPVGIRALFDEDAIGPTTTACIERFLTFTSTNSDGFTYLSIPKYFDHEPRDPSCFMLAWNLYNTRPSTVPGELSIELLMPTALMIYSCVLSGPFGLVSGNARGCRAYITNSLPLCLGRRSKAEEYALFWIFVVAIESWRTNVGDLRLEGQRLRAAMLRRFPWWSHRDTAIPILKSFFHDDNLFRSFG